MESDDYLRKAHESLDGAEREFATRAYNNATNRSYYAAFQAAVAALLAADIAIKTERGGTLSHSGVRSAFAGVLIQRRGLYDRQLRSILQDLFDERIKADYWPEAVTERRARHIVMRAGDLVNAITLRLQ